MAHSLMYGGPKCGVDVAVATPKGYEPDADVPEREGRRGGGRNEDRRHERKKEEAVAGAHVVYTDVWASMGQEAEQAKRVKDFAGWTITNALMALADKTPSSCTACPHIAARRSRRRSATVRAR